MINKKAELTITTVVVVIIALLVMVTLIYIFFTTADGWDDAASCSRLGGRCQAEFCGPAHLPDGDNSCQPNRPYCCHVGG